MPKLRVAISAPRDVKLWVEVSKWHIIDVVATATRKKGMATRKNTTVGAGGKMVFVKVRETYDLHTVQNKITVIGIHTPKADIIKRNFPGLLMQCKGYRPVSCDVRVACASMLPADPLQVSTTAGDIAPEDLFNPILYKACTNHGMSQVEARVLAMCEGNGNLEINGETAVVNIDDNTNLDDEFNLYYGLLSDAHGWRHASPQAGLSMSGLKPLVFERLATIGDISNGNNLYQYPTNAGTAQKVLGTGFDFRGNAKPLPMMNTTAYSGTGPAPGFNIDYIPANVEQDVPAPVICVGCIIVPPSRLHQLYYRMVVEWTLEFSAIRSLTEITSWNGIQSNGNATHYQTYSYESAKALEGVDGTVLKNDLDTVMTNAEISKVM